MIVVNLDKAKTIGHEMRRAKRAEEFAPFDIKSTIPSEAKQAEEKRQEIRNRYALIQEAIEAATSPEDIKVALKILSE